MFLRWNHTEERKHPLRRRRGGLQTRSFGTVEVLERRCLLSTFTWTNNVSGNFNVAANWTATDGTHGVPGSTDSAVINTNGITVTVGSPTTVNSLEVDTGTLTVNSPLSIASFTMTGGTQNGTSTLTVTHAFNWTGGDLDNVGTTTVASGATLSINGANPKLLTANRVLNNQGTGTWNGTGQIVGTSGATLNNSGNFTVSSDSNFTNGGAGGTVTFANAGTLTKTSPTGTGTTVFNAGTTLNNSGTINVASGNLFLPSLTNNGTIKLSPKTIVTDTGSFVQPSSGTLSFAIGGAPATNLFGQLNITGSASLNGTLLAPLANGFNPTAGQTFAILTYGSVTGNFTTFHLASAAGVALFASLNTTAYNLTAKTAVLPASLQTGDYDGVGSTELAVFRPSTAQWLILNPVTNGVSVVSFGAPNLFDIPVPGAYDGIGKTEVAVFRPSTAQWIIQNPVTNTQRIVSFGAPNLLDIPVPGDYDGIGKTEVAVFRPSTAQWIIQNPVTNTQRIVSFGATNLFDIPVPGDYDGVGRTELAIFRPSTAQWIIQNPVTGTTRVVKFGATNLFDLPVPGDYTGSGTTELAVFRPSTAQWIVQTPGGGVSVSSFGATNLFDIPLPNPADAALVALGKVPKTSAAAIQAASVSVASARSAPIVIAPAEVPVTKSTLSAADLWSQAIEELSHGLG